MKRRYFLLLSGGAVLGSIAWKRRQRLIEKIVHEPLDLVTVRRITQGFLGGEAIASESPQSLDLELAQDWLFVCFLRTITWAEGTWPNPHGLSPYQTIFTFQRFTDYSDHPRMCIPIPYDPRGRCSDAAGIAQWISTTWDSQRDRYLTAFDSTSEYFSPKNQDIGLKLLAAETGVWDTLSNATSVTTGKPYFTGSTDADGIPNAFKEAVHQAATEWASLPLSNGLSIGHDSGQRAKAMIDLWNYFKSQLESV